MRGCTAKLSPPFPTIENLGIELTTRCNSRCRHCFARAGIVGEDVSLDPNLVDIICTEGYAAGYRHLHLTGGEPLLWPDLFELLDRVFGLGYHSVFLNTNGLLLTDAVVNRLIEYPHLEVSVSLQGPEALHDSMRGPGSYHQTRSNISRALNAGIKVTIFTAIGKTLLARLPSFAVDLNREMIGIERLTLIQMIRVRGDLFDLSQELLSPEDFIRLVRTVSALNLCGLKTDVLNDPLVNMVAEVLQLPLVPRSHPLCRQGKLMVRANRDITLAHSTNARYGRYAPGVIANVLAGKAYREAVAPDETICPTCRYVDFCRSNGMMHPSPGVVDMHPQVPYCQRVLTGLEPLP